ncbi:MAG: (2Fe-2S) ferredoxin domain-containing protein [Bacilli bacterium]
MKSLEELAKIREKAAKEMNIRNETHGYRIVVGMATCGITAGARPVLNTLVEEVQKRNLTDVKVTQVGCMGECALEPIVEVYSPDGARTTYCLVHPEEAKRIIEEHIIGGKIIEEFTMEYYHRKQAK